MKIAVVIPCYNVAAHIEKVIRTIPAEIDHIIAVNDCSRDDTESVLQKLSRENQRLVCISHEVNQGVGGAMITGYVKSMELKADITVKMDGDGQMDPGYIGALIRPLLEDKADFTKGNRFYDFKALRKMPIVRRIGNIGLSFIIKAASGYWNIFDPTNGYTAIKNEFLANISFEKIHRRYFFETSLIIELNYSNAVIVDVPMKALYGDEQSGLSSLRSLFEFPPKLMYAFLRRLILKYFFYDFNVGSLYLLFGTPIFLYGVINGVTNYYKYAQIKAPAPTGTVVIPTMLIILGFQLLLSAVSHDVANYPKK